MKITKLSLIALATIALATACSKSDGWSVEGTLSDGAGKKIALQGFNNNNWYTIDSLSVSDNGKFSYRSATPAPYPEVLRLSLDGRSIYFPVDSVSAIDITASADDFGRGYKISGTSSAARFMTVDSLIAATAAAKGESSAQTDSLLKRNLTEIVLADNELITAYYIINKRVAGRPLFDPAVPADLRVIGAVAQSFATNRPDDPRTTYLRDLFIRAKAGVLAPVQQLGRRLHSQQRRTCGSDGHIPVDLIQKGQCQHRRHICRGIDCVRGGAGHAVLRDRDIQLFLCHIVKERAFSQQRIVGIMRANGKEDGAVVLLG